MLSKLIIAASFRERGDLFIAFHTGGGFSLGSCMPRSRIDLLPHFSFPDFMLLLTRIKCKPAGARQDKDIKEDLSWVYSLAFWTRCAFHNILVSCNELKAKEFFCFLVKTQFFTTCSFRVICAISITRGASLCQHTCAWERHGELVDIEKVLVRIDLHHLQCK